LVDSTGDVPTTQLKRQTLAGLIFDLHLRHTMSSNPPPLPSASRPQPLPFSPRIATRSPNATAVPARPRSLRPAILAISIAAITATGAYYGASLKTDQQAAESVRERAAMSVDERLERLRITRMRLERERKTLEAKMEEVAARRRESERVAILRGVEGGEGGAVSGSAEKG